MICYAVINKYGYVYKYDQLYCIYHHGQAFILTLFSKAVFPQIFNFFTVCLVHYLREMPSWWSSKGVFLKIRYPDHKQMHFRRYA